MAKFEFDLEQAVLELECVNNLLSVYREFFYDECPEAENCTNEEKIDAFLFAARSRHFFSLIDASQDKIIAMRKEMAAAIEQQYRESKKKAGEAA